MDARTRLTRRSALALAGAGSAVATLPPTAAEAAGGAILKPLPPEWFIDYGTNAEMRWDSVRHRDHLTSAERLFVRNHTSTPTLDASTYSLAVHGDALRDPRGADRPVRLSLRDLRRLPTHRVTAVHECTGNGRSFFDTQQGTPASGTQWSSARSAR